MIKSAEDIKVLLESDGIFTVKVINDGAVTIVLPPYIRSILRETDISVISGIAT